MSKFFVDYNKSSQASTILWTHEDIKIEKAEPFIEISNSYNIKKSAIQYLVQKVKKNDGYFKKIREMMAEENDKFEAISSAV